MGHYSTRWSLLFVLIFAVSSVCSLVQGFSSLANPTPTIQQAIQVAQLPPLQTPQQTTTSAQTPQPISTNQTDTPVPESSATDVAANQAVPFTTLTALSSSPTLLGQPTIFTATVSSSSPLTYTWNFGDGSNAENGTSVVHIYPAAEIYTATITATNNLELITTTLIVTVTSPTETPSPTLPLIAQVTGTPTTDLVPPSVEPPTVGPTAPPTSPPPNDDDDDGSDGPKVPRSPGQDLPVTLAFLQREYLADEDDGSINVTLEITISPPRADQTVDPNAIITVDYLFSTELGRIEPITIDLATKGIPTKFDDFFVVTHDFSLAIPNDNITNEPDEKVALALINPNPREVHLHQNPNRRAAVVTITDDDPPPKVQFGQPAYTISENIETGQAVIDVNLSARSAVPVTVDYTTITITGTGAATAGSDYELTTGTVTFEPLDVSELFTIPIISSNVFTIDLEGVETVPLTLTNAISAEFGITGTATLSIEDCTLPDAIAAANNDTATGGCPAGNDADTITLVNGRTYPLSTIHNNTDGSNGLPSITSSITIEGNNSIIERSGVSRFRNFHIGSTGTLTLTKVTIRNGDVNNRGGAILNRGTLTVDNSIIENNRADNNGGGIAQLDSGVLTVINSSIINNTAGGNGGGIDQFSIGFDGTITIIDSIIRGNTATLDGGGIGTAGGRNTISNTSIASNTAMDDGGGIYYPGGGNMSVINTAIINNDSVNFGGGIVNFGSAKITNSTISGNKNENEGGGGIYSNQGTLTIINATISNNETISGVGGGVRISSDDNSTVILQNTILANNNANAGTGPDCFTDDPTHPLTSQRFNLIENTTNCTIIGTNTYTSTDPALEPLSLNSPGTTETHALQGSSPAIDAGDDTVCPATDQRGVARPKEVRCDIGAYEYSPGILLRLPPVIKSASEEKHSK
ncbi:MAG: PKD domain-containing protein [Anaerolineae bacterium]|nr:PKD domain-containing protein [Anaerolineae bacterium]